MIDDSGTTIRSLLPSEFSGIEKIVNAEIAKESTQSEGNIPGFVLSLVGKQADTVIHEVLDCDAVSLLARAWGFARELHQYKDRTTYPPDKMIVVFLGKHALSTEVHPTLLVTIGPKQFKPVRFTVELTANFQEAALLIQDAHITGVGSGDSFVSAQLKYHDIDLHNALESKHVVLPGKLSFKVPGIAII